MLLHAVCSAIRTDGFLVEVQAFKRPPRCEAVVDADMSRRLNQING